MAEYLLGAGLSVGDKRQSPCLLQSPRSTQGGGTSELAPLHRRESSSQARGEGNGVRRETLSTPPRTRPRQRHTCTLVHGKPDTEGETGAQPSRRPWLVQSQGKGWAGNATLPWENGSKSAPGAREAAQRGAEAPGPPGNEPGLQYLGTHTHTHKCIPPGTRGTDALPRGMLTMETEWPLSAPVAT